MNTAALNRFAGRAAAAALGLVFLMTPLASAVAGPPYMTDDPEPTATGHFEIYTFTQGMTAQGGTSGQSGIDFNYGAAPNLQLTATVPMDYDAPAGEQRWPVSATSSSPPSTVF